MARLNALAIEIEALEAVELQILGQPQPGEAPGAKSSMMKTVGTELSQRLTELALRGGRPLRRGLPAPRRPAGRAGPRLSCRRPTRATSARTTA